jgi:hypothetical protein
MKIYAAALGMELDSRASSLEPTEEPKGLVLKINAIAPLPMALVCTLEPRDLRTLGRMALRPKVAVRLLHMIISSFFVASNSSSPGRPS